MSNLEIINVVIHEIKKDQEIAQPDVHLSQSTIPVDSKIESFVKKLCDVFSTKLLERAIFNQNSTFVSCTTEFNNYDFLGSSQNLVEKLKEQLTNVTNAKGGFLVFFEVKSPEQSLYVFLVRNTQGFIFEENNSSYVLNAIEYIDLDHIAMGVRINISKYLNYNAKSPNRYISLVRGNTDISEYFRNWIGIDKENSESTDCKKLYEIANKITLPDHIDSRDELKRIIVSYADNSNNRISLKGLSQQLYNDDGYIQKFAHENDIDIDSEFTLKGKYKKMFFKVTVNVDGINFSAERSAFDEKILIHRDKNQLIITSKELIMEIDEQL